MSRTSKKRRDQKKRRRRPKGPKPTKSVPLFEVLPSWYIKEDEHGQRMLLLQLNPEKSGRLFDKTGRPLGPNDSMQSMATEGNLFCENPPQYLGVRDWFSEPMATEVGLSPMQQGRYDAWMKSYEANRDYVQPADAVAHEDVCYIVAEGPSVVQNGHHLADVTRGATLAVNRVPKFFNMDFDYWLAIDFTFDFADNTGPYPNTTAIMDVCANPVLRDVGWKELRWFCPDYDMTRSPHAVYDTVRENHPWLTRLDVGLNCTFQALAWACFELLKSPRGIAREKIVEANKGKTIVLVGFDHCYTFMQKRVGEWMRPGDASIYSMRDGDTLFMEDTEGRLVLTNKVMADQSKWMMAACFFVQEAGIRVINATEGGLLTLHCEQMTLADAVKELNAGGDACT